MSLQPPSNTSKADNAAKSEKGFTVDRCAKAAFWLLAIVVTVLFAIYPTYPNYDSYYSLLWGRELLDLNLPSFEAYRAPTEHPLAVVFGAALSLLGGPADRVLVFLTWVCFMLLVWGVYRLASRSFTPLVGLAAAVLLCSSLDFPFLAVRGYIDIPYIAAIIWAAVLELERPRRGLPVMLLLLLAGLLRPEAWLLAGGYYLWIAKDSSWRQRVGYAAFTALAPLIWVAFDAIATGDPLFSFNSTNDLAEELGRQRSADSLPGTLVNYMIDLIKLPVFYAGIVGFLLAVTLTPKRSLVSVVMLAAGVGTFLLVGLGGLSVIPRYLLVAALIMMIFAGFGFAGWTVLERGSRLRKLWMTAAVLLSVYGLITTVTSVNLRSYQTDMKLRVAAGGQLTRLLKDQALAPAKRCGPIWVPNHKLIAEVRWRLDLPDGAVLARTDNSRGQPQRGVVIVVVSRHFLLRQGLPPEQERSDVQLPPQGFKLAVAGPYYAAYARCE